MSWISSLEKRFGSWAIPHLGLYIVLLQGIGFFLLVSGRAGEGGEKLLLHGASVLQGGEWWRLVSFMMQPKFTEPIWFLIGLFVFYRISMALESEWGTFRFNLFILSGYLLTVAMAFIYPNVAITNFYFLGLVFLAFATLFPHVEFLIFFVLPVKVKWLGWIMAASFAMTLFSSPHPGDRLCVFAAFLNYFIFFGRDLIRGQMAAKRRKTFQAEAVKVDSVARHTCSVCGVTDQSDPMMDFRYCSTCGECFCEEHIQEHQHE